MNIHHLELFYYVAKYEGIMGAVRNMPYGIQQPAVSGQIIQLEDDLGVKLFQRRPFQLSSAGEQLFEFVRPFFDGIDSVCDQIREGTSELLRIGAPSIVLDRFFPDMVRALKESMPSAKLTFKAGHHHDIMHAIYAGEIDLAITSLKEESLTGFETQHLLDIHLCLVTDKETKIKDATYFWNQDRIAEPLISLPAQELISTHFQKYLEDRKLSWPPQIEVSSLDLIERYVAAGLGVGIGINIKGSLLSDSLHTVPLPDIESIQVGAIWRNRLSPAGRQIVEFAKQQAARLSKIPGKAG